ncbi:hypothetical protein ACIPYS_11615 [Kitasatospora sp. NPDC089913]|uniref:hypothetical protein n=1 Tax=Kitasatospora sp. NPDC089913 TaxID=3364080 RepID=UPI0037F2438C
MANSRDHYCHRCKTITDHIKVRLAEAFEHLGLAMEITGSMAETIGLDKGWMCRSCHHYRTSENKCVRGQGC